MAFDIDMIKKVYSQMAERVDAARDVVGKPLTLSEKILYNHLWVKTSVLKKKSDNDTGSWISGQLTDKPVIEPLRS